jgi:hypothetical protein
MEEFQQHRKNDDNNTAAKNPNSEFRVEPKPPKKCPEAKNIKPWQQGKS